MRCISLTLLLLTGTFAAEPLVLRSSALPTNAVHRFGFAPHPANETLLVVGGHTATGSFRVCAVHEREIHLSAWEPLGCQPPKTRLVGHQTTITKMAIAGNGRFLISADRDGAVWWWELATGEGKLLRRSETITAVALDHRGQRAYLAFGKTLHVHDVETGQLLELVRHTHTITTVTIAPQRFAFADERGRIFWRTFKGEQLSELIWRPIPNQPPAEAKPAFRGLQKPIDPPPDQPLQYVHEFDRGVGKLVFSSDGQTLTAMGGTVVRTWQLSDGKLRWENNDQAWIDWGIDFAIMNSIPLPRPPKQMGAVVDMTITHDGRMVVTSGTSGDVRFYDSQTGKLIRDSYRSKAARVDRGLNLGFYRLACGPDGRTLTRYQGTTQFVQEQLVSGDVVNSVSHHRWGVTGVATSRDGRWLATTGDDRRLRLWRISTGECAADIPMSAGEGVGLAFSPDGRWLSTGGAHHGFGVWAVSREWPYLRAEEYKSFRYRASAFVGDSPAQIVMAEHYNDVQTVNLNGGKSPMMRFDVPNTVYSLSISPNGKLAAMAFGYSATSGPLLYHTDTGKPAATLEGVHQLYYADRVLFSPDGRFVFGAARDRGFAVWEVATGKRYLYSNDLLRAEAGVFSRDGRILAIANGERVILYEMARGRMLHSFRADSKRVSSLAFVGSSHLLATAGNDGVAYVWDVRDECASAVAVPNETGQQLAGQGVSTGMWSKRMRVAGAVNSVAVSHDGKSLAVGSRDVVQLFDLTTDRETATLQADPGAVQSVLFSPDGKHVAACGEYFDGQSLPVRVWDTTTYKQRWAKAETGKQPATLAFSPDSKTLFSAGNGVCRWDVERGTALPIMKMPSPYANAVALSPDGKKLMVAGYSPEVLVHDLSDLSGARLLTASVNTTEPSNYVYAVTFSPDGKLMATGALDGTVRVWNSSDCKRRHEWKVGHGSSTGIASLAFSPNGDMLAVAGGMRFSGLMLEVELYDVATGKRLATLYGMGRVCWSPDGRWLITAERYHHEAKEHHVLFWDIPRLLGR